MLSTLISPPAMTLHAVPTPTQERPRDGCLCEHQFITTHFIGTAAFSVHSLCCSWQFYWVSGWEGRAVTHLCPWPPCLLDERERGADPWILSLQQSISDSLPQQWSLVKQSWVHSKSMSGMCSANMLTPSTNLSYKMTNCIMKHLGRIMHFIILCL